MSDTDDSGTRSRAGGKTLSLKRTETSTVRQSFSHGRSKAVVVEKKRARVLPGAKALVTVADGEFLGEVRVSDQVLLVGRIPNVQRKGGIVSPVAGRIEPLAPHATRAAKEEEKL